MSNFVLLKNDFFLWLFLLISSSPLFSSSAFEPEKKNEEDSHGYNVILISITNLRADHLPLYGYIRNTSPNLTEFARSATVFDAAYTVSSWTLPVGISVFTSLYPFQHQVEVRKIDEKMKRLGVVRDKLFDNVITLFDIFKERGYLTGSINGGGEYFPKYGLTSRADSCIFFGPRVRKDASSFEVIPEAIRWIEKNHKKKFFLQIQAFDPHCPYAFITENTMFDPDYKGDADFTRCYWSLDKIDPILLTNKGLKQKYFVLNSPDEFSLKALKYVYGKTCLQDDCPPQDEFLLSERDIYHMIALYDGVIHDMDSQLNKLFTALKSMDLLKNTILIFYSEHGDCFGKNGRFMRGGALRGLFYDDVVHVPLIIYHPMLKPRRVSQPVSIIDIAPSLLELLNLPVVKQFKGESLVPLLTGQNKGHNVYGGCMFIPPDGAVRGALMKQGTFKSLTRHLWGCSFMTFVRAQHMKLIKETIIVPSGISGESGPRVDTFYELYDLEKDPQEINELKDDLPIVFNELKSDMDVWFMQSQGIKYEEFINTIKHRILASEPKLDKIKSPY